MGDHNTGISAAAAISAALYSREKTGKGQFVSTSLYRQGAYTVGFDMNIALLWGMTLSVGKRETMGNVAINNYIAGDGKRFWIVGLEDSVIGLRFVELLGIRNGWKMNGLPTLDLEL